MRKWSNFLQFISYFMLLIAMFCWGFTLYQWIKTEQSFESWNVLWAAVISSLFSIIAFLKSYSQNSIQGIITMTNQTSNMDLHKLLNKHLNDDELRTLCLYLNMDYDNLDGGGKSGKLRELILYFERRGEMPKLISTISTHYPNIPI